MTLQQLVDGIKRDSQTGEVGNNADDTASDIIRHFNAASSDFWDFDDWDWSKVAISFTLAALTTAAQTLAATIGRIIVLGVVDQEDDLEILTEKEYRRRRLQSSSESGQVWAAVLRGRDATTGGFNVVFVDTPSAATAIEGEGKARISEYAVSDISTLGAIPYFPVEAHPLLYDWTLGRFLVAIKDQRGGPTLENAKMRVKAMSGRMKTQPAETPTSAPPEYLRFVKRRRGGRQVL